MLQEIAIYLVVVIAAFSAAVVVQRWFDRRAERRDAARVSRTLTATRFDALAPVEGEDARRDLPFLSGLPEGLVSRARAARPDGPWTIVVLRPAETPLVGYTLLARRAAGWSARALVLPEELPEAQRRAAPSPEADPDPRRAEELATPELTAALAEADAWFLAEGPWRVVGRAVPVREIPAAVEALVPLGERVFPLVAEPDEFAGGLEWNV